MHIDALQANLVQFVVILRQLGVTVSSAELIDALHALLEIDILKREDVKTALQATLIKHQRDRFIYNEAFDQFFMPPERKDELLQQRRAEQTHKESELQQAKEELLGTAQSEEGEFCEGPGDPTVGFELTREQLETYVKMPKEAKANIKKLLANAKGNSVNSPQPLIERTLQGVLNYWKYYLAHQDEQLNRGHCVDAHLTGDDELDLVIERVTQGLHDLDDEFYYQDMQHIADKDLEKAGQMIHKLSRHLATQISRRYQMTKKKQRFDVRRSIRRNIRLGGVMLDLCYKSKRIQKPQLLLLCDVSQSMARYASFVLHFVYGLSTVVDRIESFIFSENLARVTSAFTMQQSFGVTMAEIMNESNRLGSGTNLHRALTQLDHSYPTLLTSRTLVLIVSDTKTQNADNAAQQLGLMRNKVKDIIWLNTLPKGEWTLGSTCELFQGYSRMVECNTLAHLEKILKSKIV